MAWKIGLLIELALTQIMKATPRKQRMSSILVVLLDGMLSEVAWVQIHVVRFASPKFHKIIPSMGTPRILLYSPCIPGVPRSILFDKPPSVVGFTSVTV